MTHTEWNGHRLAASALALSLVSGCGLLPKEKPVAPPLPVQWASDAQPKAQSPIVWWNGFADPTLKALTAEGLSENLDVRQAMLRVREARANNRVTLARYLPTIDAQSQAQYTSVLVGPPLPGSFQGFIGGGGGQFITEQSQAFATYGPRLSWEVPLFGLIPLSLKGVKLTKGVAIDDVRAAQVVLVGDIGNSYLDLRAAQNRLVVLQESLVVAEQVAQVLERSVAGGYTAPADAADARRQAEITRARLPDARVAVYAAKANIALLRGHAPGTEDPQMAAALDQLAPIPSLAYSGAPSVPADLLRLRPDVARAERQALLAAVEVGVARHELLPKLTFTGNVGFASNIIGTALPGQTGQLQLTPFLTVPVFDWGAKWAGAQQKKAAFLGMLLKYRDTANRAFAEADRALVDLQEARVRLDAATTAEAGAQAFATGSRAAFDAGVRSLRERLQAEQLLLEAKLGRIDAEATQARASVAVYRAFAGALTPPPQPGDAPEEGAKAAAITNETEAKAS